VANSFDDGVALLRFLAGFAFWCAQNAIVLVMLPVTILPLLSLNRVVQFVCPLILLVESFAFLVIYYPTSSLTGRPRPAEARGRAPASWRRLPVPGRYKPSCVQRASSDRLSAASSRN